ncbi:MAG: hypothetical protein ACI9Z4_000985 [Polaribacter sp.]|jgi:hypothetical protein
MKKTTFLLLTFITASFFGQVKLTSSLSEYEDGGVWKKSYQQLYSYTNGNLTNEISQNWDTSNSVWMNSDNYSYTYGSNNLLTAEIDKEWSPDTSSYVNTYKMECIYNSSGKVTEFHSYDWTNNQWVLGDKLEISYDTNNKISRAISYNWNGSAYVLEDRTIISYNASNRITQYIYEGWDGTDWNNSDITAFTYNANNKVSLELTKMWNGNAFVDEYKVEFQYDANGNLLVETYSDMNNGAWRVSNSESYAFDTSKLMSSFIHPFKDKTGLDYIFSDFPYVNKLVSSSYDATNRNTYYYDGATASIPKFNLADVDVYPNPAINVLNVSIQNVSIYKIEVYNLLGKKVLTSTKSKINVENLPKGVYLLKVQSEDGGLLTKRMIKN